MRILISAYACEPNRGSEPGVGWNVVKHLSRHHELWVVTRANNRGPIEVELEREPLPNVHWIFVDLPRWAAWWKRGQRGVQLYYYLWQWAAYRAAGRYARDISFDVAHHLTFVKFWTPSLMHRLAPHFVWGPVGGGEDAPAPFRRRFSLRGRIYEAARDLARRLAELDPQLKATARSATIALVTTEATGARVRALGARLTRQQWESGLTRAELEGLANGVRTHEGPVRFASFGRLLHLKGFQVGIEAFAAAGIPDAEYWVVGDGPERSRLEQTAERLGVADRVRFLGAVPRDEALRYMADCDVLVHPSLHDSGGWVCIEAMACAKPVVCLDVGGPSTQVTEECGFVVPADSWNQAVEDIAKAMSRLAADSVLRQRLAEGARRRAELFSWERRARTFDELYRSLAEERGERAS